MPAHPIGQHQQRFVVAIGISHPILIIFSIADMAGLVNREIHSRLIRIIWQNGWGPNRNIMRALLTAFYFATIMILSMTGYAVSNLENDSGSITLEIRAVNHRYLDIQMRMPDELRCFESMLREVIVAQLQRGKVECRINYAARNTQTGGAMNDELLQQLLVWNKQVQALLPAALSLSVADVLRWSDLLQTTLREFSASRAREGEKLKAFLLLRVEKIEALRVAVIPHVPAAIAAYEQKLIARMREAMQNADDERVRQEISLFASKIDVDEELSRLASHLSEVRRILTQGGAVGKRLDFLMQELNREANTLGSKSVDAEVSRSAMEMKILIEQMREQIQNLE